MSKHSDWKQASHYGVLGAARSHNIRRINSRHQHIALALGIFRLEAPQFPTLKHGLGGDGGEPRPGADYGSSLPLPAPHVSIKESKEARGCQ